MSRKLPLADGETSRTACVRALVRSGVDEKTGEVLTSAALAERVGWCADLVAGMTEALLAEHWNTADVDTLAYGEDPGGRQLPSNAWMALRRLGWTVCAPEGVKVNDRIVRMAQETAGRSLRSVKWRADVCAGVLASWPADPAKRTPDEWEAVRGAIPGGEHLPSSIIRSRTRQIAAYLRKHGRLPAHLFELESTSRVARMLLLSACDGQQATIERSDDGQRALLRLQLPTRPDPQKYADWTWVACPVTLPPTIPANAVLHLPTLRIVRDKVRADLAYTYPVPKTRRTGHTVALGVDWGLNTLLSAGTAQLHQDGRITALGAGAQFRAAGVLAKQCRLRRISERLHVKTDHYARLADPALDGKAALLAEEIQRVCERRSNLNEALAWSAARWAVDQAITAGATVIYLEDLRSMEAGGMGRTHNTRMSQTVRGQIVVRMRHLAAETGIAVVTVPPRNTSRHCPHCLTPLRHRKAPDRPTVSGWKWAICPNQSCGWQGDRDQGAWRRIAARGLTHQTKTVTDRAIGAMVIRAVVNKLEAKAIITTVPISRKDRSKTGPTRPRTNHLAPRRRKVPSPAARLCGPAGQRPEGHAPTDRTPLPRAAHRHQSVITTSTPTTGHRPRGAALGAGFHLHAHASPPRWADPTSDTMSRMGSLS
ncbi:zinc ribbon domain-containing protein [Streptomyces sp. Ncost-T10-10d]|uniref:zinc ribbon domain-containing protein n=1 Tax=Streptomyces sp. Ncost-T10-10d TaxID=1839774 RepID=UPI00081DE6E8|nr:zinc ribbon domain-containing protein [Streptomyces sp. Ncost-T10-10d]SCF94940.1 Putative transposase DNA-binding domain-containing protein [Streptomyces sp. Ncost-T10-10d]